MDSGLCQDERMGLSFRKSVPLYFDYRKMELSMHASQKTVFKTCHTNFETGLLFLMNVFWMLQSFEFLMCREITSSFSLVQ